MTTKKIIVGTLAIVISLGALFGGAYFATKKIAEKNLALQAQNIASKSNAKESAVPADQLAEGAINEPVDVSSSVTIRKGDIRWQEPVDIGDLGLTSKELYKGCQSPNCGSEEYESSGIKYVKSGDVTGGRYKGYEYIIVSSGVFEGPSMIPNLFRMLKGDQDYVFISNADYGIDEYMKNFIKTVFSKGSGTKEFNDGIKVEELDYPQEIQGLNDRQKFEKDIYAEAFFTDAKLKEAFVSDKYGQIWMTDGEKVSDKNVSNFELNSFYDIYNKKKSYNDIFGRYGFYAKAPDGTAVAYKMKMDIFKEGDNNRYSVLNATWNDGTENTAEYEKNPSGCGDGDYVYDETTDISIDRDLVPIGKTDKGDDLYGYKNSSAPGFDKLYNDTYWVSQGEKKKSPADFLKTRPKVYWKDYFGRILAFYNSAIISPAECGKPVIYLYPEKETEVSVKVEPGNGLTKTVPQYNNNGWNVLADQNGNLTNISDQKQYPYLFWEGAGSVYYETPKIGFSVSDSELESFFDEKLSELGLVSKEISDFKEFWIPKMRESKKPYYFATFLSKRYIDELAPLRIDPKPDTVIRVMMDYKPLDSPENVAGFRINTPERKGFTAVEWGGMLK